MADGVRVARKRVERLMREAGISGMVARKRGRTTIRDRDWDDPVREPAGHGLRRHRDGGDACEDPKVPAGVECRQGITACFGASARGTCHRANQAGSGALVWFLW